MFIGLLVYLYKRRSSHRMLVISTTSYKQHEASGGSSTRMKRLGSMGEKGRGNQSYLEIEGDDAEVGADVGYDQTLQFDGKRAKKESFKL